MGWELHKGTLAYYEQMCYDYRKVTLLKIATRQAGNIWTRVLFGEMNDE